MTIPRQVLCFSLTIVVCGFSHLTGDSASAEAAPLRVGFFDIDATPPVGSPLAYDIMDRREASLRLKGIVISGSESPIAMVAVDWIGIGGAGHDKFREIIAAAIGTTAERVAVHCLHQHDAPRFDLGTESLLAAEGLSGQMFNVAWTKELLTQAATAAHEALEQSQVATHVGFGKAKVEKVASNRRILGPDGKVLHVRWTATKDLVIQAFPQGVIDPLLRTVAFYNESDLLGVLTYYATHPQSYYRTRTAHPDFPGMAREQRQQDLGVVHIHFNGAGGNIGAGKYNDGLPDKRPLLAHRMAVGMEKSFEAIDQRQPITAGSVRWAVVKVELPPGEHLNEQSLEATLQNEELAPAERIAAANSLAFLRRCQANTPIDITCLSLASARLLHLPGELFVEYQLHAAQLRPDRFVAMAAYGDYAPGYIGTEIGYQQGGYETSQRASRVAPAVEHVLNGAIEALLAE